MQTTLLSTILSRMDRWRTMEKIEETYKVRDLDSAIRQSRRLLKFPWLIKKSSLKVFDDVLIYPVESDHDEIIYVENSNANGIYGESARLRYTSLQQFYENPDGRNDMAEIRDGGEVYLGIRYKGAGNSNILVDNSEDVDNYSASGDATSVAKDTVTYKRGNASMRVAITNNTGIATITISPDSLSDSLYKKKYLFADIYLASVPTSIELRIGNSVSNYLYSVVTSQFAGQDFKAGEWNTIAINLDEATEQGTFDYTAIDYSAIIINGAESGTYYIDSLYLRDWTLMDYWYYSNLHVLTSGSVVPDQKFFFKDENYDTSSSLLGDDEWVDVVMYDAMLLSIGEKENEMLYSKIYGLRQSAWQALENKYPSMEPLVITQRYNMGTDYNQLQ